MALLCVSFSFLIFSRRPTVIKHAHYNKNYSEISNLLEGEIICMMFFNIIIALSIVASSLLTSWTLIKMICRMYGVDLTTRLPRKQRGIKPGKYCEYYNNDEEWDKGTQRNLSIDINDADSICDQEFEDLKKRIEDLGL